MNTDRSQVHVFTKFLQSSSMHQIWNKWITKSFLALLDLYIIAFLQPQREYSGRKVLWGNVVAQKLDTLMVLTFDHLQSCYQSGRLDQVDSLLEFLLGVCFNILLLILIYIIGCFIQVFKALLQSFQSTVLNAYKSKFAQVTNRFIYDHPLVFSSTGTWWHDMYNPLA